jgi:3-hydroxyacyl-CoA dehydrogenase
MTEQIEHIAVIGAGYMGGGIAQVFAWPVDVVICDADPELTTATLIVCAGDRRLEKRVCSNPVRPTWCKKTCGPPTPALRRYPRPI